MLARAAAIRTHLSANSEFQILPYGRGLDALPLRSQRLSRLSVVLASIQRAMSKPSPPSRGRSHRPESHEALEHSFLFRLWR